MARVADVVGEAKRAGLVAAEVEPLRYFAGLVFITRRPIEPLNSELPDQSEWALQIYLKGLRP